MTSEQRQSQLEASVQQALQFYDNVRYNVRPSFEANPSDPEVRGQIIPGESRNGVLRNAVGDTEDLARLKLAKMEQRVTAEAQAVLTSDVYKVLQTERLGDLSDDERVFYQLDLIAGLDKKEIKVEGLGEKLETIVKLYTEGKALKEALESGDKAKYVSAVRNMLKSEHISALDALYTRTALGRDDEPAIRHEAEEIARVQIKAALDNYKKLEAEMKQKHGKDASPYKVLAENQEKGAYLAAYDAINFAYVKHKKLKEAEARQAEAA